MFSTITIGSPKIITKMEHINKIKITTNTHSARDIWWWLWGQEFIVRGDKYLVSLNCRCLQF